MEGNKKGFHKSFVPGEFGVTCEHDKIITKLYPFGRLDNIILRKRQVQRINHRVKDKQEKPEKPGNKKHIR
jgi:hypothetical protein